MTARRTESFLTTAQAAAATDLVDRVNYLIPNAGNTETEVWTYQASSAATASATVVVVTAGGRLHKMPSAAAAGSDQRYSVTWGQATDTNWYAHTVLPDGTSQFKQQGSTTWTATQPAGWSPAVSGGPDSDDTDYEPVKTLFKVTTPHAGLSLNQLVTQVKWIRFVNGAPNADDVFDTNYHSAGSPVTGFVVGNADEIDPSGAAGTQRAPINTTVTVAGQIPAGCVSYAIQNNSQTVTAQAAGGPLLPMRGIDDNLSGGDSFAAIPYDPNGGELHIVYAL